MHSQNDPITPFGAVSAARFTSFVLAAVIFLSSAAPLHAKAAEAAAPPYVFNAGTCRDLGPAILDLYTHTNAAVIDADTAAFRADALASSADYKYVEDNSAATRLEVLKAYTALGPILTARVRNSAVTSATRAFAEEAQGQLQVAQQMAQLSLTYERTANAQNKRRYKLLYAAPFLLVAPVAAAAYMASASGEHTRTTTTTGTVGGQPFTSTTTTRDYAQANAMNLAVSEDQAQRKEALELYAPQVSTLPYVLGPLSNNWVEACKQSSS